MLNINSLNNVRDQKQINKIAIYKKVLEKCHHRIVTISQQGGSQCIYIIPEFMYGIPRYDIYSCSEYIISKLKKNGFRVAYVHPNFLYIDWSNIPSQLSNQQQNITSNNNNTNKSNNHRRVSDYKISTNFMNTINH